MQEQGLHVHAYMYMYMYAHVDTYMLFGKSPNTQEPVLDNTSRTGVTGIVGATWHAQATQVSGLSFLQVMVYNVVSWQAQ